MFADYFQSFIVLEALSFESTFHLSPFGFDRNGLEPGWQSDEIARSTDA